jgi:hypothetical protein
MREGRSARSRLIWGLVLLVFGAFALAINLGFRIPRDFWDYWPAIPLTIGLAQMAWPGSTRDRLSGYWLVVLGIYGFITVFEIFGLHWGTSWPIWIVALGIRIVLGGILREGRTPDQGGASS